MHSKLRFPVPRIALPLAALFVALAGTAVAANPVPTRHGTRLAVTRADARSVRERPHATLLRDAAVAGRGNPSFMRETAVSGIRTLGAGPDRAGETRVVVQTGRLAAVRAAVLAAGGHVERTWRNLVQATVPPSTLRTLSDLDGVTSVRPPVRLMEHAVAGEEIATSLAAAWHEQGFTGKGVKVAIIDGGFAGLAARQASGDLPASVVTADFCGGHFGDASPHGTAVAEIVHEVAPAAQLYLLCIGTDVDLAAAESFAKSQGVDVINLSGGFLNAGRGDGTGPLGAIVADARAAGILWVNSAGNEAQTHWSGPFSDPNGDRVHEFAPGDIGNTFFWPNGAVVCGALKWDEWPAGVSDFDLFLILSATGQVVGDSSGDQSGTQPPTEGACFINQSGSGVTAAWVIYGYSVRSTPRFDLFSESPALEHQTAAGSVADPATSPAALAVGAVCWQTRTLEPYSSQGPTIDGRTKPDLVAHDSVSSATYGAFSSCPSGFAGTSASAPEVTGTAALVKQAFPAFRAAELQAFLLRNARDLGAPGADNATGAGELQLPAPPDRVAPTATAMPSNGNAGAMVILRSRAADESGRVRVIEQIRRNGRVIATLRSPFASAFRPRTFSVGWRASARAVGALQHCVQAEDAAGNKSTRSCAGLTLR
jgi:subtilisin family serine protease